MITIDFVCVCGCVRVYSFSALHTPESMAFSFQVILLSISCFPMGVLGYTWGLSHQAFVNYGGQILVIGFRWLVLFPAGPFSQHNDDLMESQPVNKL